VLDAAGLTERDLKPDYSSLSDATAGLSAKTLDAFFLVGGYPSPAIAELAAATPIRLVPISDEGFDKAEEALPIRHPRDDPRRCLYRARRRDADRRFERAVDRRRRGAQPGRL